MRISDLETIEKNKFKPKAIAIHYGGFSGPLPADKKEFILKHIKTNDKGQKYISQYPDKWYWDTFSNIPEIKDFNSFLKYIHPFVVQRTWHPAR